MKLVSTVALAAALVVGGMMAAPADAQKSKKQAAQQPQQRKFNISKEAAKAVGELQAAVTAKDTVNYAAKLAAAEAVAKSTDDRYLIAKFRLQYAMDVNDVPGQDAAVQAIIASGGADATETATLRNYVGRKAIEAKDYAGAETLFTTMLAANPNDLDATVNLARAKIELKKDAEALNLLLKAIQIQKAAGQNAPEGWYRNALGLAYKIKNTAAVNEMNSELMRLYPSKENFKNSLIVFREGANLSKDADLDLMRLMYVSGSMSTPGEYIELASLLDERGLPGEAKSVVEAGIRAGVLKGSAGQQLLATTSSRIAEDRASLPAVEKKARAAANGTLAVATATAYASYGDYAKAIELYRLGLQKGGVDAGTVNTRLGVVLTLAGQKAEAEAAFRAVSGANSGIAALWLSWLGQRA
jgi:tetratricopeptide (TPR) repeat protein